MMNSILASARRDTMRFACIFLFGTNLLSAYHYLLVSYGHVADLYTLAATGGPFSVTLDASGALVRGPDTASFRAGQNVGWSSTFCAEPGRAFSGHTEMVQLAQDGLKEQVVSSRTTHFQPDVVRCGPREYALRIPEDAVPGVYELRRTLTFREESWWPLRSQFPPLTFRVVGAPTVTFGEPSTK